MQVQNANVSSRVSYLGPGQPVPPEDDPRVTFDRLFADLAADPESVARKRAHRRRVLDTVMGDYHALQSRLGSGDREKLQNHLGALAEIEKRLDATGTIGGSCAVPTLGDVPETYVKFD